MYFQTIYFSATSPYDQLYRNRSNSHNQDYQLKQPTKSTNAVYFSTKRCLPYHFELAFVWEKKNCGVKSYSTERLSKKQHERPRSAQFVFLSVSSACIISYFKKNIWVVCLCFFFLGRIQLKNVKAHYLHC